MAERLRKRAEELTTIETSYGFETRKNPITGLQGIVGGWDTLDDGTIFDDAMRYAYRVGSLDAPRHEVTPPPNPFLASTTAFVAWLNEPVEPQSQLTRYLRARYNIEPGFAQLFPRDNDPGAEGYVAWIQTNGRDHGIAGNLIPHPIIGSIPFAEAISIPGNTTVIETQASEPDQTEPDWSDLRACQLDASELDASELDASELDGPGSPEETRTTAPASLQELREAIPLPPQADPPTDADPKPVIAGINVVGLLRAEFGIGTAARLLLRSVERSGVPYAVTVDDATAHRQEHPLNLEHQLPGGQNSIPARNEAESKERAEAEAFPYPLTVIVLNADGLRDFTARRPKAVEDKTVVGLWFWELEEFPQRFWPSFDLVDEVWVASEHVRAALSKATKKPVRLVPLGAMAPNPDRAALRMRAEDEFGIGKDRFVVSYLFDYASVAERKNPWGAVEAYCRAFPNVGALLPDGRVPVLILKTISSERHPADVEHLRFAIGNRADIVVIESYLSSYVTTCLLARTDCYLSLHRAEGWGLTIAEAMAVGTPVVATGYSGNMDFMDTTCTYVVPGKLVPIPAATATYAGAGRWADPDLDTAAELIQRISGDPTGAESMGLAGQKRIAALSASFDGADFIREQTNRVAALRHATGNEPSRATEAEMDDSMEQDQLRTNEMVQQNSGETSEHSPDSAQRRSSLAHAGLGPVILPPSDYEIPLPPGARGAVRTQIEKVIKFEIDRRDIRDHRRSAAIVDAIRETREAVRDTIDLQLRDQDTLTTALNDTNAFLRDLHASHLNLYSSVVEIGRHTHEQGNAIGDLGGQISQLRDRVEQLSRVIERLTEKLQR